MKNVPLLVGTLVVTVAMVVGIVFFFSRTTAQPQQIVDQSQLVAATSHVKGPENAPITIVEFSDFQCPACRAAYPLVNDILAKYPDKVRVYYRHFPISSIHPYAELAARASEVAAEDGKFWEYHDVLFEKQSEWSTLKTEDEVKQRLADYGQELGIDKASFVEKIDSDRIKSIITADLTTVGTLNLQGTPTFYVNGQETSASQLMSTVESRTNN